MDLLPECCLEAENTQACGEGKLGVNIDAHTKLGNDLNKA